MAAGPSGCGSLGEVVAPVTLGVHALVRALGDRTALVLVPSSARGWFGGRALVAWDPHVVGTDLSVGDAGAALQTAFDARHDSLTCALLTYEGQATVLRFGGGLAHAADGWRVWGSPPADAAEVVRTAASLDPRALSLPDRRAPLLSGAEWDTSGRGFRASVEQVRECIADGDVYVVNLTARLEGTAAAGSAELFGALLQRAGAEMSAAVLRLPGLVRDVISVSPERFVRVSAGPSGERRVEVCPIKGTRPRGSTPAEDAAHAEALAADPKERAEHVMVVDLERNDLGVVCVPATVGVDPLYQVVPTPYCHQLVSTVAGTLGADATIAELLEATFPCGSVTGAPKRAAIQVAADLERTPRGAYCGSLLVAAPGQIDSAVLIRTLEVQADGRARWGSGCGITFDSDPAAEHLELLLKASPVIGDGTPAVALRETARVAHGRVPLFDRHLARLAAGGCGPTLLARVRTAAASALAAADATAPYARLGITVTPDGSVTAAVSHAPSSLDAAGGPRIAPVRIAGLPELPAHAAKPAARSYWDRAHRAARMQGAEQAVLVTGDGILVDGSTANVWLVSGGGLATPPAPPAVAGVMREVVFDIAAGLGMPAEERQLTIEDLETADEVLLTNAVGGAVAVRGRGGAIAGQITSAVEAVFSAGAE